MTIGDRHEDPEEFATFGELARRGRVVVYTCPTWGCVGPRFTGEEGSAKFGAGTSIEIVRRRLRCSKCGRKGPRMEVYTPGPDVSFGQH